MNLLGLEDELIEAVEWTDSSITELDLTSTELNVDALYYMLTSLSGFEYLAVGHCEFFEDKVLISK